MWVCRLTSRLNLLPCSRSLSILLKAPCPRSLSKLLLACKALACVFCLCCRLQPASWLPGRKHCYTLLSQHSSSNSTAVDRAIGSTQPLNRHHYT